MTCFATLRPHYDDQTVLEMAGGDKTHLAVVKTLINQGRRQASEHFASLGEIDAAMFKRKITLRRIERDPHRELLYPQIIG